ncbi:MAG: hypothetical protein ABI472_12245 [Ginsengibacter sp.]
MIPQSLNLLYKAKWHSRKLKVRLKQNYFSAKLNSYEKEFKNKLSRYKIKWNNANKNIVLTQVIADYEMCIKFALATNHLAKKHNANIGLYPVLTVLDFGIDRNKSFRVRSDFENMYRRMEKVFMAFGGRIIYRNTDAFKDKDFIETESKKIKDRLNSKEDIINIHIEGMQIGDLVYDTYLRMNHKCTVDLQDIYLTKLITEVLHVYYNCKAVMAKYNIVALVNSYTTYIHHGIIVRLLLKNNIPVYTVGGHNSIVHKVIKEYPSHQNNHFEYPSLFQQVTNKEGELQKAKASFESRFTGKIDTAIGYMKESSFSHYHNFELDKYEASNTVVVLAHCFFDSPHIYRGLVFPDFYEWINFTLTTLSRQPHIHVLVKPHPNGIVGNDEIFAELEKKYAQTNIIFIDKKTSNLQLIEKKPRALVTAYGTAAAEFAYHHIPVLAIYDNPFTGYDFITTANTSSEYENHLNNIMQLKVEIKKEEILEYYYMQSHYFLDGINPDYLNCKDYVGKTHTDDFLINYLPNMSDAFFERADKIIKLGFNIVKKNQELKISNGYQHQSFQVERK